MASDQRCIKLRILLWQWARHTAQIKCVRNQISDPTPFMTSELPLAVSGSVTSSAGNCSHAIFFKSNLYLANLSGICLRHTFGFYNILWYQDLQFKHTLYKKLIPLICSEPAVWTMSLGTPVSCVTKSNKVMNNYSLHAFPISMILHVSHLLQLKLISSALFNFSPSVSHTLPLSISLPFCKFLAVSICDLVASTVHSIPARYGGTTDYRAAQLLLLQFLYSFLQFYLPVWLQLALSCIFKEPPSQSHQCYILPSSMLCASGVKQPARTWIRFRTLNPWLERWP